jgi:hypothetical protein
MPHFTDLPRPQPAKVPAGGLVTGTTRGIIVRALKQVNTWTGRRHGIKMVFRMSSQPNLRGERIEWRARIGRVWSSGVAGTVWDAIKEIEQLANQPTEEAPCRTPKPH